MAEIIALLGAESTGKTTLAAALAARIGVETGLRCGWVPELLRGWCERAGRVPRRDEQAGIAAATGDAIDAAARDHDVVVADTTPLMIAVYSRYVFGDDAISDAAVRWQRRCALTLVTAIDIGWVADGLQREGRHVQAPVDALIRELLARGGLAWSLVAGSGDDRLACALDAVAPLLRRRGATPRDGFFTRLAQRNVTDALKPWRCERCDDPDCEHSATLRGP